jgi:hypothetical protein
MDSGFLAEPVIGPRFARTRWPGPGLTGSYCALAPEALITAAHFGISALI